MAFKKVNIKEEVENLKREDPEFKQAFDVIEAEYALIKKAVDLRKELGVSQPEIAKLTGLKQQTVSRIETVGNTPTLRSFIKYLEGIGLEVELKKKDVNLSKCVAI
jgi:DNA-binding XRE family transcriptional regulator